MKKTLYNTNSLCGFALSIYANLDFGRPIRLRSKSILEYMHRFYHLTHIGLLFTSLTFAIGVVLRNRKYTNRNNLYSSTIHWIYIDMLAITVTTECFIPLMFWILWQIDKSSVVTTSSYVGKDSISMFFNLCMHGFPTVFLLVEFFFSEFLARNGHYFLLFFFFVVYLGVMLVFNRKTGTWPYRIIEVLTGKYRLMFFAGCFGMLCVLYFLLSHVHYLLWKHKSDKREKREGEGYKTK